MEAPMCEMMAAELDARGALAMFWFQGLSEGKSCWPSRVGTMRSSSSSAARIARSGCRPQASQRRFLLDAGDQNVFPTNASRRDTFDMLFIPLVAREKELLRGASSA